MIWDLPVSSGILMIEPKMDFVEKVCNETWTPEDGKLKMERLRLQSDLAVLRNRMLSTYVWPTRKLDNGLKRVA